MAPKVLAGIVNVNSPTVNDEIHAPMGGVRDSGWGRTGPRSLDDFSDVIWINSHSGQRQYPVLTSRADSQMANAASVKAQYDFIVVGAGAAGSVLAAELSASGAQVLVDRIGRTRRRANDREPEHLVLQRRRAARLPPARQVRRRD